MSADVELTNDDIDKYIVEDLGFIPELREAYEAAFQRLVTLPDTETPQYVACTTIMDCPVNAPQNVDGFPTPMVVFTLFRYPDIAQILEIGGLQVPSDAAPVTTEHDCYFMQPQHQTHVAISSDDYIFLHRCTMMSLQFLVPADKVQIVDGRVAVRTRLVYATLSTLRTFDKQNNLFYKQFLYQGGFWSLGGGGTKACRRQD